MIATHPPRSCPSVWSWDAQSVTEPACLPTIHSLPRISFIWSLLLFPCASGHTWCPRLPPTDSLSIPQVILLNEALQGGSLGPCDVRVAVRGHCQRVKKKKKRRRGGREGREQHSRCSVSAYRGPLNEEHWTLSCKLIGGKENAGQKNKCRNSKHKGSDCSRRPGLLSLALFEMLFFFFPF